MTLQPGSIEWGPKRSALETFDYVASDLALCHRHEGEWVGLMNVPHLRGSKPESLSRVAVHFLVTSSRVRNL